MSILAKIPFLPKISTKIPSRKISEISLFLGVWCENSVTVLHYTTPLSLLFEDVPHEIKFEVGGVVWYAMRLKSIDVFAFVVEVS